MISNVWHCNFSASKGRNIVNRTIRNFGAKPAPGSPFHLALPVHCMKEGTVYYYSVLPFSSPCTFYLLSIDIRLKLNLTSHYNQVFPCSTCISIARQVRKNLLYAFALKPWKHSKSFKKMILISFFLFIVVLWRRARITRR